MKNKLKLKDINEVSLAGHDMIEQMRHAVEDTHAKERLESCACKLCFYRPYLTTAEITQGECEICESAFSWNNGNTPILCEECSKKHKFCKYCASDVNFKIREKDTWNQ